MSMRLVAPRGALVREIALAPEPGAAEVLIEVAACGVCRTDLHIVDGELAAPRLPLTPGHEIVGKVVRRGLGAGRFVEGAGVGVPWLAWTCGRCGPCASGRESAR